MAKVLIINSEGIKLNLEKLVDKRGKFRIPINDSVKSSYERVYKDARLKHSNLVILERDKEHFQGTFYRDSNLNFYSPKILSNKNGPFSLDMSDDRYLLLEKFL